MTKYKACFKGREVGAIGVYSHFNVDVEADNIPEAELKLYETHDHIDTGILWLWKGKQTVKHFRTGDHKPKGCDVYVSTYNGETWKQTDCNRSDVERIKAEHLADTTFMDRVA